MSNRSAHYSVKGYLYQFCKTIEQILSSADNAEVTVEGVEDIDLDTADAKNLIQCKYHEATRFVPSVVYKPIGLMLSHFLGDAEEVMYYTLYAYFKDNAPTDEVWITNEFLRKSLAHIKDEKTPTDDELASFMVKFRFQLGDSFDNLKGKVQSLLQSTFSCSQSEVELYYYNNAIAKIIEMSAHADINQRRIRKNDFQSSINKKHHLFDIWQSDLIGKQAYLKAIKERLKNAQALNDNKRRFLFISNNLVNNPTEEIGLYTLISNLVSQYNIVGKLYNSELWTVVIDAEKSQIQDIKSDLIKNGIYFNDGYEDISFCGRYFNDMPIKNKRRGGNKIAKTSHNIRLVSATTFEEKLSYIIDIDKYPHVFINTSKSLHENQYFLDSTDVAVYRLPALGDLSDLNNILKKGR